MLQEKKIKNFKKSGGTVLIFGLPDWGMELFQKSGLVDYLGKDAFYLDEESATGSVPQHLKAVAGE